MYTTATLVNPWPGEACARTSASFVKFYQAIFSFFHLLPISANLNTAPCYSCPDHPLLRFSKKPSITAYLLLYSLCVTVFLCFCLCKNSYVSRQLKLIYS